MSETLAIKAEHLRRVYARPRSLGGDSGSDVVAVDDLSFNLSKGSCLAIVGESGSGKTTAARMLIGLEVPTSGSVEVGGARRPKRMNNAARRAWARKIQMVFQDAYSSLDPRQSIGSSIEEILRLHFDLDRQERSDRATELLERVQLDARVARSLPKHLSGGQRQRVAIARALAAEPDVLILDESVAALDVSIQAQVLNVIADLRRDSAISYVFITHDLAVARFVADDIIVMQKGLVVERGEAQRVLGDPQQDYTKRLISSVPRPGWKPVRVGAVNA
ncbi:ABC transporter ATP-binding protein [Mycolicibacterium sp. P9-64]|uniref:ABC transporter ATP-binding protein n=1 Tax=Mycolicibacterium sp. P9-64 TaxID=2024612 RepID=UPI0011F074F5|nr:ATP-binding cassette domain-containing protein [Mycolicibacterium sp. P9-64]KAA0084558.1 ABC transporter ATP-binding protein [Mycolicibacterium sp. P9-64]